MDTFYENWQFVNFGCLRVHNLHSVFDVFYFRVFFEQLSSQICKLNSNNCTLKSWGSKYLVLIVLTVKMRIVSCDSQEQCVSFCWTCRQMQIKFSTYSSVNKEYNWLFAQICLNGFFLLNASAFHLTYSMVQ